MTRLVHKLTVNDGEGLYNLCIWFPLFASCWLVSGLIIKNLNTFSYFFLPLIGFFIFYNSQEQRKKNREYKVQIIPVLVLIVSLYSAYLYQIPLKPILVYSFLVAMAFFVLDWYLQSENIHSILTVILKSIVPLAISSSFVFLGIFSQYETSFESTHLTYIVLGVIPGLVLMSRACLQFSHIFEAKGWEYQKSVETKKGQVMRPQAISRLIIGLMILGPAIPSLLMPFNIIPETLFVVSLSFLMVPRLAQRIQSEEGSKSERIVHLTFFAFVVTVLTFIGAALA